MSNDELRTYWNSDSSLGLLFGASRYLDDQQPFDCLAEALPLAHFIGASSAGAIHGEDFTDDCLQLTLIRFEHARMAIASALCDNPEDSFALARDLGDALTAQGDLTSTLVFADGLRTAGHDILRGLSSGTNGVPIAGGMAADGVEFRRTWVMHQGRPTQSAIAVLGFYGLGVNLQYGCASGPVAFGPTRRVTASQGPLLLELDGRPALQVYRDYLGEYARQLPASAANFPLGLRRSKTDALVTMRFVLAVDDAAQGLLMAGDMPTGSYVQLARATHQQLINAAGIAGQQAMEHSMEAMAPGRSGSTLLSLVVSCAGRRVCLGERTGEDLESVLAEMPPDTVQTGFFSYGEFATHPGQFTDMHNMTMAVIAISEPLGEVHV